MTLIPGYNQPRPTQENYQDFMTQFVRGLERLGDSGISFMVYGSYVRGDYIAGRSDIDAILIFPDEVVINKKKLALSSQVLTQAMRGNPITFQVTVTDIATMHDGRFNSYNPSFRNYFLEEGRVLVGPDYRSQFRFEMPFHPEQNPLTFNLRKSRQGLFFADYDKEHDYGDFLRKFGKTLDAVSRGSKQLLFMFDDKLTKNRFSALEKISEEFPNVDIQPLIIIKELYHHPEKLDALYRHSDDVITVWNSAVNFLEQLTREYIRRVPNHNPPIFPQPRKL